MKTNSTAIKGFKAVDFMREVRDKISMDIKDMNFEEIQKYMETRRLKLNTKKLTNTPVSKQFENETRQYSETVELTIVSEPLAATKTAVEEGLNKVNEPIKSISAIESAKLAFNRLGEKYNCTFDNKYTK